jgi:hypothetical protein
MAFQGRQTVTNACQVFVPIFFIAILWLITDLLAAAADASSLDLTPCLNASSLAGSTACSGLYFTKVTGFELRYQQRDNATAGDDDVDFSGGRGDNYDRFMVDPYVKFLYSIKSGQTELGENKNELPKDLIDWYLRLRTEVNFAQSCAAEEGQCNFFSYTDSAPKYSARGVCDEVSDQLIPCNSSFDHPQDGVQYETCQYGNCLEADAPKCTCDKDYSGDSCRDLTVAAKAQTVRESDRPDGCVKNKDIEVSLRSGLKFNPFFCEGRFSTSGFEYKVPAKKFDAILRREECAQEKAWCSEHYNNITSSLFDQLPGGFGDGSKDGDLKRTVSGFLSHVDLPFLYQEDTASLSAYVFQTLYGRHSTADAKRNALWVFRQLEFIKASGAKGIADEILDRWGKASEAVIGAYDVVEKDSATGALEYTAYLPGTQRMMMTTWEGAGRGGGLDTHQSFP